MSRTTKPAVSPSTPMARSEPEQRWSNVTCSHHFSTFRLKAPRREYFSFILPRWHESQNGFFGKCVSLCSTPVAAFSVLQNQNQYLILAWPPACAPAMRFMFRTPRLLFRALRFYLHHIAIWRYTAIRSKSSNIVICCVYTWQEVATYSSIVICSVCICSHMYQYVVIWPQMQTCRSIYIYIYIFNVKDV